VTDDPIRPIAEQWAVDVYVQATTIRMATAVAAASHQPSCDAEKWKAAARAIDELLVIADGAIDRRRRLGLRTPCDWWRGTSVAKAYKSLHAAEVFLVELLPEDRMHTLMPGVVARADAALAPADPRRQWISCLSTPAARREGGYRAAVQQAMRIGYDASDRTHTRLRNFRNILLASAFALTLLMWLLVVAASSHPRAVPLCFASGAAPRVAVADNASLTTCPHGEARTGPDSGPSSIDIWIVAGLGVVGGALATAYSIRNARGATVPYNVPVALGLFKLPLGALTAVCGILLLGGDFVPGFSRLDSQPQILAYALVFGYAQQLVSRLVDDRARTLLSEVPNQTLENPRPRPATLVTVVQSPAPALPDARETARRRRVTRAGRAAQP
jgi:hypothetical protein